jgi:C_GCAxxG_C_C family probable redox protein
MYKKPSGQTTQNGRCPYFVRDELLIKAMGGLGGGIAADSRGICGALLGGVAFISSLYGRGNWEEKEQPLMWRLRQKLTEKFEDLTKEYGGIYCSNIARVNFSDREQVKAFRENPDSRRQYCVKVVEETAVALGEILEEMEKEADKP